MPIPEAVLGELKEAEEVADLGYLSEQVPDAFDQTLEGIGRVTDIVRAMKEFTHPAQQEKSPTDLNQAMLNTITVACNEYKYVAEVDTELGDLSPAISGSSTRYSSTFLSMLLTPSALSLVRARRRGAFASQP